jgi:hypothetical protein
MHRRKRLRKKLHRLYLSTVCAWVVTFDDVLRQRLRGSEPGTPFPIRDHSHRGVQRLLRRWGLRYLVATVRKLAPQTATVVYWAQEFPEVRDQAVIFSAQDLGN